VFCDETFLSASISYRVEGAEVALFMDLTIQNVGIQPCRRLFLPSTVPDPH